FGGTGYVCVAGATIWCVLLERVVTAVQCECALIRPFHRQPVALHHQTHAAMSLSQRPTASGTSRLSTHHAQTRVMRRAPQSLAPWYHVPAPSRNRRARIIDRR